MAAVIAVEPGCVGLCRDVSGILRCRNYPNATSACSVPVRKRMFSLKLVYDTLKQNVAVVFRF